VPARRAMARWASRLLDREWHQQLLVLRLITVAVVATIPGAAISTNTPPSGNDTFGTVDYRRLGPRGSQPFEERGGYCRSGAATLRRLGDSPSDIDADLGLVARSRR
jgi:hypothetical protein